MWRNPCQRLAPKLLAISTSEGEMALTPARASSTMIQMANSTTVMTMVVDLSPNSTMITGTRAVSGADRNMLTHGSSARSAISERPISTPSGTPARMAMALPNRNALAVIHPASAKLGVGTISTMRIMIADKGGMTRLAPERPTISHKPAQISREASMGILILPIIMALLGLVQVALELLPDRFHRVEIGG